MLAIWVAGIVRDVYTADVIRSSTRSDRPTLTISACRPEYPRSFENRRCAVCHVVSVRV